MHKVAWDVGIRIRVVYICAGFLLLSGALRLLNGRFRLWNLNMPILLGVIWIGVFALGSVFKVVDYPQYVKGILALFVSLYLTVYLLQHIKDPETAELFWRHWWRAGLIMVVYGFVQWGLWWFFRLNLDEMVLNRIILNPRKTGTDAYMADVSRITSLALDTNNFSLYLSTILPLSIYRLVSGQTRRERLVSLLLAGLVFFVNVFTLSRSGWGGLIISSILVLPLFWLTSLRSRRLRRGILVLAGGAILIGILMLMLFSFAFWERVIQARLAPSVGTSLHFQLLANSFDLFSRSPLIGWGINQFSPLYKQYYRPDPRPTWNTHNGFLTIMVDMGLLGLLGYASLFIYTIVLALNAWSKAASKRQVSLFLLWGYTAYLIGNMGYNAFGFTNFWMYQALLISSSSTWLKRLE